MNKPTKEDVQEALYFVAKARKAMEKEIMELVNLKIGDYYNKTGIPITNIYVYLTEAKDLKGDSMTFVNSVNCYTDS